MYKGYLLLGSLFALVNVAPLLGGGCPSFIPDATLKGSNLAGWHAMGPAKWNAANGELTGTPGDSGAGGWLVLNRSYQDVGLFLNFRCTGGCETGVLFRAEKTPDGGLKGSYVSLSGPKIAYYDIAIDANGKIIKRTPLRPTQIHMRIAPPPNPNKPTRTFHRPPFRRMPRVNLPLVRPDSSFRLNRWNQAELIFDANILRCTLNNGLQTAGVADSNGYGPIAFYVGGAGKVQFKDIAYKDLGVKSLPAEKTSNDFRKRTLNNFYYSWGAAAADFNHDGILDVVSGPYIYYGPDYTKRREIYLAQTYNPSTQYAEKDWMEFAADFTGDGWPDVITAKFGGPTQGVYLYVNPEGQRRRWNVYRVVDQFNSEIAVVRDIDGDGKPAIVYMAGGYVRYAKPDPSNPTGPWVVHNVSKRGYATAHGIGVGDINGDGRLDIVNAYGWWEHPPSGSAQASWTYHPQAFARYGIFTRMGGSVMAVYDVNGDHLNDVVTVLDAHDWGMAWFEQKRDAQGHISFVKHMIMDDFCTHNAGGVTFSEAHGDTYADMNGDGIPDFVVGKRYWSHLDDYADPDPYDTPVLYWYETVRDPKAPGGARFVPHLINNRSGAGSNVLAADLNHDGAVDVVTATRFGTFVFWNEMHSAKKGKGQ